MLRLMRFHEFALQRLTLVTVRNCTSCTSLSATRAMPGCITLFVNGIYGFRARKRKVFVGTAKRAEVKPQFFQPASRPLIKAVRPWDRMSVDFKGPVRGPRPYLLIVVDE